MSLTVQSSLISAKNPRSWTSVEIFEMVLSSLTISRDFPRLAIKSRFRGSAERRAASKGTRRWSRNILISERPNYPARVSRR